MNDACLQIVDSHVERFSKRLKHARRNRIIAIGSTLIIISIVIINPFHIININIKDLVDILKWGLTTVTGLSTLIPQSEINKSKDEISRAKSLRELWKNFMDRSENDNDRLAIRNRIYNLI